MGGVGDGAAEMGVYGKDERWGAWCSVMHTCKSQHSEEGVYLQFEVSLGYLVRQQNKKQNRGLRRLPLSQVTDGQF